MSLLTGHCDVHVRADVINWHAKIAESRRQREVIDETTLTRVDLETDSGDYYQYKVETSRYWPMIRRCQYLTIYRQIDCNLVSTSPLVRMPQGGIHHLTVRGSSIERKDSRLCSTGQSVNSPTQHHVETGTDGILIGICRLLDNCAHLWHSFDGDNTLDREVSLIADC